jgi:enoyl-[acyl-carrier protein] reductase II
MRTRLTELLKIDHPVMLAGMGGVSYHQVVAALGHAQRHVAIVARRVLPGR